MKEAKHSRKAKQSISQSSREASCDFGSTINSWVAQRSGRVFLAQSRHDHTWTSSAKLPKRRLEMAGFPNTSSKGAVGRTVISISFRRLRVVCFGRNTIRVDSSVVLINSLEMSREDRWTFAISRTWRDCRPAKDAKGSNRKEPEDRPANPDADLIPLLWHSLVSCLSLQSDHHRYRMTLRRGLHVPASPPGRYIIQTAPFSSVPLLLLFLLIQHVVDNQDPLDTKSA
ncbi:hypothetical protein IWX50DRAFT_491594 [Phyllosticta citricarpa]